MVARWAPGPVIVPSKGNIEKEWKRFISLQFGVQILRNHSFVDSNVENKIQNDKHTK